MTVFKPTFAFVFLLIIASTLSAKAPDPLLEEWKDAKRNRVVPVKIYLPADLSSERPAPVVLFSHGLGGSREGGQYLGTYWAEHGYISIHVQHPGSDESVWRGKGMAGVQDLREAANGKNLAERINDIDFVIDHLTQLVNSRGHELSGKADLDRIAMSGHSFGSHTTLAIAGQVSVLGAREISNADVRVKCAIALSPSPPANARQIDVAFSKIKIPVYHLTGTKDTSTVQATLKPEDRKIPYEKTTETDQYLLYLTDADHATFGGAKRAGKRFDEIIQKSTTAFLDAYLKNDAKAKTWLRESFKEELKDRGRFAWK